MYVPDMTTAVLSAHCACFMARPELIGGSQVAYHATDRIASETVLQGVVLAVCTAMTRRMCMASRLICSFTGLFDMAAARADGFCVNRPEMSECAQCSTRSKPYRGAEVPFAKIPTDVPHSTEEIRTAAVLSLGNYEPA
jgi:hypothetical protein